MLTSLLKSLILEHYSLLIELTVELCLCNAIKLEKVTFQHDTYPNSFNFQALDLLLSYNVFEKSFNVLHDYQAMASIHDSVGINETLCIIGRFPLKCLLILLSET